MIKYFCDQTGEEINGCIYKVTVVYPMNGKAPSREEQDVLLKLNDLSFSSLEALARYFNKEGIE